MACVCFLFAYYCCPVKVKKEPVTNPVTGLVTDFNIYTLAAAYLMKMRLICCGFPHDGSYR